MLTMGSTSNAAPPQDGKLSIPPHLDSAKCKDSSDLHKPCDGKFKVACKKKKGQFTCDNDECTEGTCHLPDF